MAIQITQQPTTPNAAFTNLVYVVSGSVTTSNPQYQYVMDVMVAGDTSSMVRVTQTKNPNGVAVFDPSPIIQGKLNQDNYWRITGSMAPVDSVKDFTMQFGEQYGTSISSSVTVFPNLASSSLQIFQGDVNPNNGVSYNFNTSSFDTPTLGNPYLTNNPGVLSENVGTNFNNVVILDSTDYFTVTTLQDTVSTPASVLVRGFNIQNGGITSLLASVNIPLTLPIGAFNTIGLGIQNMANYDTAFANPLINLLVTGNDAGGIPIIINDRWDGVHVISGTDKGLSSEYTKKCGSSKNFAFINRYGFWDYYAIYNPVRTVTDLTREKFDSSFVDYSSQLSPYSVNRRGDTQYYASMVDKFSIDTDYIDKEYSNWLEEMMESPSVYLQENNEFIPIIITNTNYKTNNETSRNKLFKYTIEWEYANQRRSRV
jgi:hypothetical protein